MAAIIIVRYFYYEWWIPVITIESDLHNYYDSSILFVDVCPNTHSIMQQEDRKGIQAMHIPAVDSITVG